MGQMMNRPLLISSMLCHAARYFGNTEIVSRRVEGDVHRYTYRDCLSRAGQLANVLGRLDVAPGDRVATLAWNGYRHLELYYAVSGAGAVIHTLNPRLHVEQITYIVNHAEDRYVFFDLTFLPIVEAISASCPGVKGFVALCARESMPTDSTIANLLCYEDLLCAESDCYTWPSFDENTASSLCYTSGTTGAPKGVLYSHRSTVLHSYASAMVDVLGVSVRDTILPAVPMFHVNAWGLPYSSALAGAKLVFPGPALDGKSLYELIETEKVTFAAGVPTVWLSLLNHARDNALHFSSMKRTVIGGASCPPSMITAFRDEHNVEVIHAWGMTELSPLGTTCTLQKHHFDQSKEQQLQILQKQGHAVFGVELKIVDDNGVEVAWDGKTSGNLLVRGSWVVDRYFKEDQAESLQDKWFVTGDVATISPDGYMQITDRSKDVIKSGGEWIGSIDLENIAMSHPAVHQAACIGVPHPKWDERPLLIVVRKEGCSVTEKELLSFYGGKIARWWTPDHVVFIDSLPIGGTGKILKNKLREQFRDFDFKNSGNS